MRYYSLAATFVVFVKSQEATTDPEDYVEPTDIPNTTTEMSWGTTGEPAEAQNPMMGMMRNVNNFQSHLTSGVFEEAFQDCRGNTISNGRWFKPKSDFFDKSNSLYHFPSKTRHKKDAWNYCQSKGMEAVTLWCPKSLEEADSVWSHHPANPMDGSLTQRGLMTGIYRETNYGNEYYCNYASQDSRYDSSNENFYDPLYKINDYFDINSHFSQDKNEPHYIVNGFFTNDILMSHDLVNFRDFRYLAKNNNKWQKYAFVCEMNCDYIDEDPVDLTEVGDTLEDLPDPVCPVNRKKRESPENGFMSPEQINDPVVDQLSSIMDNSFDEKHLRSARNANDPWSECSFPDIDSQESAFESYTEDCNGVSAGAQWYRPKEHFYEKPNTVYHLAPLTTTTKLEAFQYCQSLGQPNVKVWCPGSRDEAEYIWGYHPTMSVKTFDDNAVGLWTGIFRRSGANLEYQCAALDSEGSSVIASDMYDKNTATVQYWKKWDNDQGYPKFGGADDVVISWDTALMHDVDWEQNSITGAVVCEMELPECVVTTTTVPPTTLPACFTEVPDGTINIPAGSTEDSIPEILSNSPCDITANEIEEIKLHGCHCWKLGALSGVAAPLGGKNKIDFLDNTCHEWHDRRTCLTLSGGACEGISLEGLEYQLSVENGSVNLDCSVNSSNACMEAVCQVDVEFVGDLLTFTGGLGTEFTATIASVDQCPFCENCRAPRDTC